MSWLTVSDTYLASQNSKTASPRSSFFEDDATTIRDRISDDGSDFDEPPPPAFGDEPFRWSTSTFGNMDPTPAPHLPPSRDSNIYSDFGSDDEWSDREDYGKEVQVVRHITQWSRSVLDIAPRAPLRQVTDASESTPPETDTAIPTETAPLPTSSDVARSDSSEPSHHQSDDEPTTVSSSIPSALRQRSSSLSHTNLNQEYPIFLRSAGLSPPPPPPRSSSRLAPAPLSSSSAPVRSFTPPPISTIIERIASPQPEENLHEQPPSHSVVDPPEPRTRKVSENSADRGWTITTKPASSASSVTSSVSPVTPVASSVTRSESTTSAFSLSQTDATLSSFTTNSMDTQFATRSPIGPSSRSSTLSSLQRTLTRRKSRSSKLSNGSSQKSDVQPMPSTEAMSEVQRYEIFAEGGTLVRFGSLYPATKMNADGPPPRHLVLFVGNFSSGPCQDYIMASVNKLDVSALDKANISVTIIASGPKEGIKGYRRALRCPFPVFADPSAGLYKVFGFRDAGATVGPDNKPKHTKNVLPVQMAQGFIRYMVHFPQGTGSHDGQLGGAVIIGPDNRCEFIHRMAHPRDHMEAIDIIRAPGSQNGVDYLRYQAVQRSSDKRLTRLNSRKLGWGRNKLSSSRSSSQIAEDAASTPAPHRRTHLPQPKRENVASNGEREADKDMILCRSLDEDVESSESHEGDSWSSPGTSTSACSSGLCDLVDSTADQSASDFKNTVQKKYAAAAVGTGGSSTARRLPVVREHPHTTRPVPRVALI